MNTAPREIVTIDYTNWRGERRKRRIVPVRLHFSETKWHPEIQWLLDAVDVEENVEKSFAMKDIHSWE